MITIQMLVRDDEKTIGKALESIEPLRGRIVIGNLGSRDKTISICDSFGAEIVDVKWDNDYSGARNGITRDGMNMYLEPWEVLARGHESVLESSGNTNVYVVRNGMVSKEIRIWRDSSFVNPVYETIVDKKAPCRPEVAIVGGVGPDRREEASRIVESWMKRKPTSPEPYYYTALSKLSGRKYSEFYTFAKQYLAMDKEAGSTAVMLHYHMAQIELHTGDLGAAVKNIFKCISLHPEMAEFWCLLGDVMYKAKRYEEARQIYKNALVVGKRRRTDDPYPVDVAKYGDYPEMMIENIKKITEETGLIGSLKN
jgi:hypothetical protein